jgi:hypothetical protein
VGSNPTLSAILIRFIFNIFPISPVYVYQPCIKLSQPFDPVLREQFVAWRYLPGHFLANLQIDRGIFCAEFHEGASKKAKRGKNCGAEATALRALAEELLPKERLGENGMCHPRSLAARKVFGFSLI